MKLNRLMPSAPRRLIVLLTAASILLAAVAAAQGLKGRIIGTVLDEQGAAIPGAQVRLSSPAMIGGTTTQQTDKTGQFLFLNLTPGMYALDIEMRDFVPHLEKDVRIGGGDDLRS